MYPAKNNSPTTVLTASLNSSDQTMTVENASVLPPAPNLAVIGSSDNAEIVLYTAISGNTVTIVRGQNGTTPGTWSAGSPVARNFTAMDHEAFRENILDLEQRKTDTGHTHDDRYYTGTEVNGLLAQKSNSGHTHDDRYYTEEEIDAALAEKTPLASGILRFTNRSTSGSSSSQVFCTIDDAAITEDHVVLDITFSIPSSVTSNVSWATTNGRLELTGINASATNTVSVTLGLAGNI